MKKIPGNFLRKLRKSKGCSLRDFSEKIYISKSSIQRWEKTYLPNDEEILKKIADVFEMTVDEMYEKSIEEKITKPSEKQLTEMQFGIKGLAFVLTFLAVFVLLFILINK